MEDDVTVYVEYPNGATGVFITTTGDACGTNRLEIQMDKARIIAQNDTLEVTEYEMTEQAFSAINTSPFGTIHTKQFTAETDGENTQHIGVINAWGGAILRNEPLIADGREGINGLMLSNAMHLSSWLGKTVELPIDADLYYEELMKRVATSKQKKNVVKVIAETDASYAGSPTGEYKARWNTNW